MDAAMSLTSTMDMPHLGIKVGVEGLLRGVYCRRAWYGKGHSLQVNLREERKNFALGIKNFTTQLFENFNERMPH